MNLVELNGVWLKEDGIDLAIAFYYDLDEAKISCDMRNRHEEDINRHSTGSRKRRHYWLQPAYIKVEV